MAVNTQGSQQNTEGRERAETAKFPRMPSVATDSKAGNIGPEQRAGDDSASPGRRQMKLEGRQGYSELQSVTDRMESQSPSRDATSGLKIGKPQRDQLNLPAFTI